MSASQSVFGLDHKEFFHNSTVCTVCTVMGSQPWTGEFWSGVSIQFTKDKSVYRKLKILSTLSF